MKKSTANRKRKNRKRKRQRERGFLLEINLVPVYQRFDKFTQKTVKAAYFNDYCMAQIGTTWDDAMACLLEFNRGYMEIEEYWQSLRKDFYDWAAVNGINGWGVHMYQDR